MMDMATMRSRFSLFAQEEPPPLNIDLHSHLIPSIDDGSKSMQETLTLLKAFEEAGYQKVITTPHIMVDRYENGRDKILRALEVVHQEMRDAGLKIVLEAGAEYYFDEGFIAQLKREEPLAIAKRYILFETPYSNKPLHFDRMVDAIFEAGYQPILAHPERYRYIEDMEAIYPQLKERGLLFQLNINSFGGHYGYASKRKAQFLSQRGMVDFLGSDVHHLKQVYYLRRTKRKGLYREIFKNNLILNNIL
jgi:protein-tyrosine phosphatase